MRRILPLAFLFALSALAQPATTPIQDTVYDQFARPYTGTLRITLSTPGATQNSAAVVSLVTRLTITAGVLTTALVPNDTMTPPGSYYVFAFGTGDQRNCVFPTSATPLTLAAYCAEVAPATPLQEVLLTQLNGTGLQPGQGIMWTGTGWKFVYFLEGYSIDLATPATSDTGLAQHKSNNAYLLTGISCTTDQGTVQINLDVRTEAAPNTPGTNVLASPLTCGASGTATNTLNTPLTVAAFAPTSLQILSTSGSPGVVRVHIATQ